MFYILVPLIALVGGSSGQEYPGCDYAQQMIPDVLYYLYNPTYPQNYSRGTQCRWTLKSERPFRLSCGVLNIPVSEKCSEDALIVKESDDVSGHRYCGRGNFTIVSETEKLTVILSASSNSPGGYFLCTARTQTPEEENSNCRCGWKNPTRIVGGKETGVNEYPMMAALIDLKKKFAFCGATIINKRQLVTAAHCVQNRDTSTHAVLVGDHDLSKGRETNASKLYQIESFTINRLYDPMTFDNDIALLTVLGNMAFSQQVGPACLPFHHSRDSFAGSFVDILGWGLTQPNGGKTSTLQKATVPVITNSQCRRDHSAVTLRQICTRAEIGVDSCQFDSGGPLLWQNPSTRRLVEIGVISSGRVCAIGEAAKNTRIGAYINWIVANTPPGITYCPVE